MTTYKIKLLGLPRQIVDQEHIVLDLNQNPDIEAIIREIKNLLPAMSGSVFSNEKNILAKHYIFNINGRFHLSDSDIRISPEDRVILMALPLGG